MNPSSPAKRRHFITSGSAITSYTRGGCGVHECLAFECRMMRDECRYLAPDPPNQLWHSSLNTYHLSLTAFAAPAPLTRAVSFSVKSATMRLVTRFAPVSIK